MNNKDKFLYIISPVAGGVVVALVGIILGKTAAGIGLILVLALWALSYIYLIHIPAIKEKKRVLWEAPKKVRKIQFWFDIHKSAHWKDDNQIFICIHNESFFRKIKSLSVLIAFINKIEKSKFDAVLSGSAFLEKNVSVPSMKGFSDIPFIEVMKNRDTFIIREIDKESPDKIIEHEFGCGKYKMQIVFKRNDTKVDSYPPVPVYIQYDGSDKMFVDICDEFPKKTMFPIAI